MSAFDPSIFSPPDRLGRDASAQSPRLSPPLRLQDQPVDPAKAEQRQREPSKVVLKYLAEQAVKYPPQDIRVLAATVQKYLLVSLEPALRMAEQLREEALASSDAVVQMAHDDRRHEAMELLAPEKPRTAPAQ